MDQRPISNREKLVVLFGMGLIVWGIVMSASLAPYPDRPIKANRIILAVELPKSDADLRSALAIGTADQQTVHDVIAWNTALDFLFIFWYAGFLITFLRFASTNVRGPRRWLAKLAIIFIGLAAAADILENFQILGAMNDLAPSASAIRLPSQVKWVFVSVSILCSGILLLGRTYLPYGVFSRLLGLSLSVAGIAALIGVFQDGHGGVRMSTMLLAVAPLTALLFALRRTAKPSQRGEPVPPDVALEKEIAHVSKTEKSDRSALCLSGGGIRSATFNLGLLKGLASHDLLPAATYLSTVSGGGFIGGWLSALIKRGGLQQVNDIRSDALQYLRSYSNYLSPRLGLLSADTWTLGAIYLRNLLLTWMVMAPCALAALMIPRFVLALYASSPPAAVRYAFLSIGATGLMLGAGYIGAHLPSHGLENSSALVRLRHVLVSLMSVVIVITDTLFLLQWSGIWWLIPIIGLQLLMFVPLVNAAAAQKASQQSSSLQAAGAGQIRFITGSLIPLMVSALTLTACWNWLPAESVLRSGGMVVTGGTVAILITWLVCATCARANAAPAMNPQQLDEDDYNRMMSMLPLLLAALLASLFAWFIGTRSWVTYSHELYTVFAVPLLVGVFLVGGTLMAGLTSRRTTDDDEEWWARAGAWLGIATAVWLTSTISVLYLPSTIVALAADLRAKWVSSQFGFSELMKLVAGIFGFVSGIFSAVAGFSSKTPGNGEATKSSAKIISRAASVGAGIGLLYIFAYLSLASNWIIVPIGRVAGVFNATVAASGHSGVLISATPFLLLIVTAFFIGAGCGFGALINTNRFSLHYYWRNRLVRAYLGASRGPQRSADPFIGFSSDDNVQMHDLRTQRPFQVVNIALNLTRTRDLAWQERKAESFTVTPLYAGNHRLGYRDSRLYGRTKIGGKEGISLGTAMALSGAAVSPNMGYMMSSPVLRLVMTIVNLRLGAWLGNPGIAGNSTFYKGAPTHSIIPIVNEAFGLVDDTSAWVYLSDGGHFENLGLYEMVRRKCKYVLVGDASTDPDYTFESLAVAVRKIRIDQGISIEINRIGPIGRYKDKEGMYYALGTIRYTDVDPAAPDGHLIYVKPSLIGGEPQDVLNYANSHPEFPQETIADQFFTESQFESYRKLGEHIIDAMCKEERQKFSNFADFYVHLTQAAKPTESIASKLVTDLKKAVTSA